MNKSKIEWCDYTWNPITGCRHDCEYCYARKMSARFSGNIQMNMAAVKNYRSEEAADGKGILFILDYPMLSETGYPLTYPFGFEPTLHRSRYKVLDEPKTGSNIFVGSMADMWGPWVPDTWIRDVMLECEARPRHNYLFLTKTPERYAQYGVPAGLDNMWYGTSITTEAEMGRFNSLPAGCKTYVSMEPILEDLQPEQHNILFRQVDWIILGAESGKRKTRVTPQKEWIQRIVHMADQEGLPVFMKDSLVPIVGEDNMRRQFPEQLLKKCISPRMEKKLYDTCCICKARMKKSEMIALSARSQRREQSKQFAFACQQCFKEFCEKSDISIPKLEELK